MPAAALSVQPPSISFGRRRNSQESRAAAAAVYPTARLLLPATNTHLLVLTLFMVKLTMISSTVFVCALPRSALLAGPECALALPDCPCVCSASVTILTHIVCTVMMCIFRHVSVMHISLGPSWLKVWTSHFVRV